MPEVSLLEPCLPLNVAGADPGFFLKGGGVEGRPNKGLTELSAPVAWVQEVSEGDVPASEAEKNSFF